MPEENDPKEPQIQNSNFADVLRELIRAIRDIFNDWRVALAFLILIATLAGSVAGPEIIDGVEKWIRAWRSP